MTRLSEIHELLLTRLASRTKLDEMDRAAVRDLPITTREHDRFARIVREGERPATCGFIASGFAFRSKVTVSGGRQIVGLLVPGDLIDLQQIVLPRTDHDVEALSPMLVGDIVADQLLAVALGRPAIGRALWTDILVESSVSRELLLNNCRRDAPQRIAHQLCEFAHRLGKASEPVLSFDLPLTQEQLADMTGLTGVHVNRTLRTLRERELIDQQGRTTVITDWDGLTRLGGFSADYLHLDAGRNTARGDGQLQPESMKFPTIRV